MIQILGGDLDVSNERILILTIENKLRVAGRSWVGRGHL